MLLQTSDVKIKKISENSVEGVFEFSPLPQGFGRTLGSGLRRVLLTSLTGGAITEIKIPGVTHQFSTIKGVREDVVNVVLNLKQIYVKVHANHPVMGRIEKKGKGPVTAADIEVPSDVEIVNKDAFIAELSDSSSKLEMDITFANGVGYSAADSRENTQVGSILVDALYSPVRFVSYDVEETRLGRETGLDKLLIRVRTDDTVAPSEAITEASTLLRNFFSRFAKGPDPEEVKEESTLQDASSSEKDVFLEDLDLNTRTINALKRHGVETLSDLAKLSDEEIADIKNLGEKSISEIKKILENRILG